MNNQGTYDMFWRANGRATMVLFWVGVGVYTYLKYFNY